jgi:CspA family cold shock protein
MSDDARGVVVAFDEATGLGEVERDDGVVFPFHCIEITDGTRTIAPGTNVNFGLLCKLGRYEAARVSPI